MRSNRLTFEQWRARALKTPEYGVDHFLGRLQALEPKLKRSFAAARPDRETLLHALQSVHAEPCPPLAGIPYALQDMFDIRDLPTTCGSSLSEAFEMPAEENCLLYERLKELGAAFFLKTVPAEFGVALSGDNPAFGRCPHPDNEHWIPGGGAGSSARAVADGYVPLAFGLDTCGGIRLPAALHGLFGFRMENNTLAREGVFPIAPTIDSIGCVTAHIDDLSTTIRALCNPPDPNDAVELKGASLQGRGGPLDPEIKAGIFRLTRELDIDENPPLHSWLNHALRDTAGALETLVARELHAIHRYWLDEYRERYAPSLLRRIEQGEDCSIRAAEACNETQEKIRSTLTELFKTHDYLICPICPVPTPNKDAWNEQLERHILDYLAPASLAFMPAVTLPFNCSDGRHGAVQIIVSPRRLEVLPALLAQVTGFYAEEGAKASVL